MTQWTPGAENYEVVLLPGLLHPSHEVAPGALGLRLMETGMDADAGIKGSPLLRVEGLKTYFFQRNAVLKAVDGASFTVGHGEAVGLAGESGSGKTMTCLSLMQLNPKPGSRIVGGEVWFRDQNLMGLREHEMREYRGHKMAMIMQDP